MTEARLVQCLIFCTNTPAQTARLKWSASKAARSGWGLTGTTWRRHRPSWGDELAPGGRQMANTWQGDFPYRNTAPGTYQRTTPVGSFPPNGYGLSEMIGNAWEWTTDSL